MSVPSTTNNTSPVTYCPMGNPFIFQFPILPSSLMLSQVPQRPVSFPYCGLTLSKPASRPRLHGNPNADIKPSKKPFQI